MIAWRGNGLVALIAVLVSNTIRNAYPWLWLVGLAFCHFLLVLRQSFERTG